jgi:hypothetical protein
LASCMWKYHVLIGPQMYQKIKIKKKSNLNEMLQIAAGSR